MPSTKDDELRQLIALNKALIKKYKDEGNLLEDDEDEEDDEGEVTKASQVDKETRSRVQTFLKDFASDPDLRKQILASRDLHPETTKLLADLDGAIKNGYAPTPKQTELLLLVKSSLASKQRQRIKGDNTAALTKQQELESKTKKILVNLLKVNEGCF
jgi:hypothetical protein